MNENKKMLITFSLLIVVIFAYFLVDKYIIQSPKTVEKEVTTKKSSELTDDEILKLGYEKYYSAVAILTNTKSEIDKIYNPIKTNDIILTDDNLINELNNLNLKQYTQNSSVSIVSNYEEAIENNFTDDFINNNILLPNGYITKIGEEYYIVKEKTDNLFFKETDIELVSKSKKELYFKVADTNYDSSCATGTSTTPSIICTDTVTDDEADFRLIKEDKVWKIKEITI